MFAVFEWGVETTYDQIKRTQMIKLTIQPLNVKNSRNLLHVSYIF